MNTTNAHFTSAFILKGSNGKLHSYQFRPTENYTHHRPSGSDVGVIACGTFIVLPTHDVSVGDEVECKICTMSHSGIQTTKQNLTIVAKESYVWDYSKPIGQRKESQFKSGEFDTLFKQYREQPIK